MYLNWPRLSLLSGVLFVLFVAVGFALVGLSGTDNSEKLVRDFADHRERILIGGYLVCLGLIVFVAWGWGWQRLLARTEHSHLGIAILLATALTAAVEFPVPALFMSLAYISDQPVDPQVARAFAASAQVFSYVDYFPTVLLFASMGWAIVASRIINRWFGYAAFLVAVVSLVVAYPPLQADILGAFLDGIWIAATAVALFVSPAARSAS